MHQPHSSALPQNSAEDLQGCSQGRSQRAHRCRQNHFLNLRLTLTAHRSLAAVARFFSLTRSWNEQTNLEKPNSQQLWLVIQLIQDASQESSASSLVEALRVISVRTGPVCVAVLSHGGNVASGTGVVVVVVVGSSVVLDSQVLSVVVKAKDCIVDDARAVVLTVGALVQYLNTNDGLLSENLKIRCKQKTKKP